MVFASGIFLFMFLPVAIVGYWLLRKQKIWIKNLFLLIMSMGFYLECGIKEFILLILSVVVNYVAARLIVMCKDKKNKKNNFYMFHYI